MKKVKNYIDPDLAKKKIARYKYWSVKDENGITILSSDDNSDNRSFGEVLDKIFADNVDAEVQIKYGTNEQSSRQNPPFFIQVNEAIEWIEPEEPETVQINGVPHKLDKNGNVNINLNSPRHSQANDKNIEVAQVDTLRHEMDIQLDGLRRENELNEVRYKAEMQNKLVEQDMKFKEMLLAERESRCSEREHLLAERQAQLESREDEMQSDVKGYVKHIPNALGSMIKDWLKSSPSQPLSGTKDSPKRKPSRNQVKFSIQGEDIDPPEEPEETNEFDDLEAMEILTPILGEQEDTETPNTLEDEEL